MKWNVKEFRDITTFLIKYQGVDSFELPDLPLSVTSVADVAEPSGIAILVVGLVGLGVARRRTRPSIG